MGALYLVKLIVDIEIHIIIIDSRENDVGYLARMTITMSLSLLWGFTQKHVSFNHQNKTPRKRTVSRPKNYLSTQGRELILLFSIIKRIHFRTIDVLPTQVLRPRI